MLPLDKVPANPTQSPLRSGVLREFILRQDRVARDQRVDLREIQESFRVSFSDEALAASSEGLRGILQKGRPADERGATELKLKAYQSIAAL